MRRGSWSAARTTCTSTSAPDVVERRIDDVGLARRFAELGLAGLRAQVALHLDRRAGRRGARRSCPASMSLGAIVAQPGGRRDEPARGRDRGARGRADRVAADRRLVENERAHLAAQARRQAAGLVEAAARAARAGASRSSRSRSSTRTAQLLPGDATGPRRVAATAWCSPPGTSRPRRGASRSSTPRSRARASTTS